jgi:hypothetical protein
MRNLVFFVVVLLVVSTFISASTTDPSGESAQTSNTIISN